MQRMTQENMQCRVSLVSDGEEAMRFVHREGVFAKAPPPTWSSWIWSCPERMAARC